MTKTTIKDKFSRVEEWKNFSDVVISHIENYTLPQYGDTDTDQIDEFSTEECWKNVQRYFNRRNTNVRGVAEQVRDVLKVAHYMSFIFHKMGGQNNDTFL